MMNTSNNHKMPALFLGHGSPMYVIEENPFDKDWKLLGKSLPIPRAILSISDHWETPFSLLIVLLIIKEVYESYHKILENKKTELIYN